MTVTNDVPEKRLENYEMLVKQMRAESAVYGADDPVAVITGDRRLATVDFVVIDDNASPAEKKNLTALQKNAAFVSSGNPKPMDVIREALKRPADVGGGYSSPDPEASGNFAGGVAVAGGSILAIVFWPVTATVAGGLFLLGCFSDGTKKMNPRIKDDKHAPDIHVAGDDIWGDGILPDVITGDTILIDRMVDTVPVDIFPDIADAAEFQIQDFLINQDILNSKYEFVSIEAGNGHTCVLDASGHVYCWGWNTAGQMGNGTYEKQLTPVMVSGLDNAVFLSPVTGNHTCAIKESDSAWCWGENYYGQLGDGTKENKNVPVKVMNSNDVLAIAGGFNHTCLVRTDKSVLCMGKNEHGQLGDGTNVDSSIPVKVNGLSNVISVDAGFDFTCALTEGGSVWCWGSGANGKLGNGNNGDESSPVQVIGLKHANLLSVGGYHACAVRDEGLAFYWGVYPGNDGACTAKSIAAPVYEISNIKLVATGHDHSCAVADAGAIWCWGDNFWGQFGIGGSKKYCEPEPAIDGWSDVKALSGGYGHTCAIVEDGASIWCWGANHCGELGNGEEGDWSWKPTQVLFE